MLASQITAFGPADVLQPHEVPVPEPGEGQVRIRLHTASVNRADVLLRSGRYHTLPPLPAIPGSEGAGVVDALGAGVTGFEVGDRVVAWGGPGFYAEYAVADVARTVPLPDGVVFDAAAALPVAWLTARYCLFDLGRLTPGQTVLVLAAASGVGTAAVQLSRHAGATVIAVVGSAEKADFVRRLGADVVVNRHDGELLAAVHQATDGKGADVVLETVGGAGFAASITAAAAGGRVVALANVNTEPSLIDTRDFYARNVSILGFQFGHRQAMGWDAAHDLAKLLGDVADGTFDVPVGARFPLRQAAAAHEYLESGDSLGKALLSVV
jgi:NADPH2:quinone reductase